MRFKRKPSGLLAPEEGLSVPRLNLRGVERVDPASMGTLVGAKPPVLIAKVQGAKVGLAAANAVTVSWDVTPTEGNLLVALGKGTVSSYTSGSITGWSQAVGCLWGTTAGMAIFYKIAGASEGDVTLNWTNSDSTTLLLMEWGGVDTLDQVAFTGSTGSGVTSRSSGTTPTTTAANELCFAGFVTGNVTSAQSFSNSFVDEYSLNTDVVFAASKIVSAPGAQETTMSWTTSRFAGGLIATFKA